MLKVLWRYFVGEPGPEKPRCTHEWEIVVKTTCPPMTAMPDEYGSYDFDQEERFFRGVTQVLHTCRKCGYIDVIEMLGQPV